MKLMLEIGEYENDIEMQYKMGLWTENRDAVINDYRSTQTSTLCGIFLNYIGSNVIGLR